METPALTAKELRAAMQRLKFAVALSGLRPTAKELGLSPTYVCEILSGKCPLGRKAQDALAVKRKRDPQNTDRRAR